AIPAVPSTNNQVPGCYYNADDYTCVKDDVMEWWDPSGQDPNSSNPGCWRMVQNGKRYLNGEFPPGNLNAQFTPSDLCNGWGEEIQEDAAPPTGRAARPPPVPAPPAALLGHSRWLARDPRLGQHRERGEGGG